MDKQYLVNHQLLSQLVKYLAQQPYKDVFQFVGELQNLKEADITKEKKED